MPVRRMLLWMFGAFTIGGCATTYQPHGLTGGYSEKKIKVVCARSGELSDVALAPRSAATTLDLQRVRRTPADTRVHDVVHCRPCAPRQIHLGWHLLRSVWVTRCFRA